MISAICNKKYHKNRMNKNFYKMNNNKKNNSN